MPKEKTQNILPTAIHRTGLRNEVMQQVSTDNIQPKAVVTIKPEVQERESPTTALRYELQQNSQITSEISPERKKTEVDAQTTA